MSNAAVRSIKFVASLFTPSYYKNLFWRTVDNNRDDIRNGSIRPLFKAIGLVWISGYSVNYLMMKRHQVYPKIAAVKAVEAAQHH